MGHIKGQFVVDALMFGAYLYGAVYINDEVACNAVFFARNGVIAKADDIRWPILTKVFTIGQGNAFVISEDNADFAPTLWCSFSGEFKPEPIS